MPLLPVNGTRLWVEDSGGDGPPVVFSHGLLWSTRLFDAQVAALRGRWRCVAWDHRGQGRSEAPRGGPIALETVYDDAVALLERLALGPVHFVGLSMGGFVGLRLAARRPDLVRSLALLDSSADPESPTAAPRYRRLAGVVRWLGPTVVAGRVLPILFGRTVLTDPARAEECAEWRERLCAQPRAIWRAVMGVVDRAGAADLLGRIAVPTLVLVGEEDAATPLACAERLAAGIAGARLVVVPGAGHSSPVEQPARVTAALAAFLDGVEAARAPAPGRGPSPAAAPPLAAAPRR